MNDYESNNTQAMISADFDSLFKMIKSQEDIYHRLNDTISKVINNRAQIQENLFIHDEIIQHKQTILKYQLLARQFQNEKNTLLNKHPSKIVLNQRINLFLKRVCFRVFQVLYNTINQAAHKIPSIYQKYLKLKHFCQKLLGQSIEDKSYQLLKCISDFVSEKMKYLINCLSSITKNLENGNFDEIDKLQEKEVTSKIILRKNDIDFSKENNGPAPDSHRVKIKMVEKKPVNKEEKCFDRIAAHKKVRKVMDSIKDVMQLNRQQFIEDCIDMCQQKKERAIKQLLQRNSCNKKLISEFIQKKAHKRKRKLSSDLLQREQKRTIEQNRSQMKSKSHQTSNNTIRKSLLLKFKDNQYRQRASTSQFYKKINKTEESKFKILRNSYKQNSANHTDREKKNAIIKAIQQIICQNEELEMKVNNKDKSIEHQEKLPPLNKRASSVDQNYQEVETEQSRCSTSKNLSTSIKENQSSRIKKSKMERSEVFTSKMKTSTNFLYQDINSKLIHINDLNKQVLF